MCLHADVALQRDGRILLSVVDGENAVDPSADARPFAEDAVFIPLPVFDHAVEGGLVDRRGDDLVAAVLVPDRAPIADAGIYLIAGHAIVLALATHLDAGVRETFLLRQLHLEAHFEISVSLGCREEGVFRDIFLHRAADDIPVLDFPPFLLSFGYFPASKGFPIEKWDRGGA